MYTKVPMSQKYTYIHKHTQMHTCKQCICIYMCIYTNVFTERGIEVYEARLQIHARQSKSNFGECMKYVYGGVAATSRIDNIIGLYCKRAL